MATLSHDYILIFNTPTGSTEKVATSSVKGILSFYYENK